MRQVLCGVLVLGLLATTSVPAFAQGQAPTQIRSGKLALAGLLTAGVGATMLAPVGEEYHILGSSYCSTGNYTLNYGECQTRGYLRPFAFALIAAGAGMTVFGLQRVKISPALTPTVKGATATVRW